MGSRYVVKPAIGLNVREGPSISANKITALSQGTILEEIESAKDENNNTWVNHDKGGWSAYLYFGSTYLEKIENAEPPATTVTPTPTIQQTAEAPANTAEGQEIASMITQFVQYNLTPTSDFKLKSARSIMGLPHQFLSSTDERVPDSNFGRMYTEAILMDMPICTIVPGGPKFLTGDGITDKERNDLTTVLANAASTPVDVVSGWIEGILGGTSAKYYSFQTQYAEYIQYVNTLNRTTAQYLGIQNKAPYVGADTYNTFNWETQKTETDIGESILKFLGSRGNLNFYYDKAGTGMSEFASNSTDKSLLESAISSASNTAKEAQFLLGIAAGTKIESMDAAKSEQRIDALSAEISTQNKGLFKGIIDNLKVGTSTIVTGSNMLLPEIWRDSNYGSTYSMDMHLASPYGTPEAFYLNVAVPLNFLIALAFPRSYGANGYYAPFLIQAYSKGVFAVDMGIVESLNISRFGSGDSISRKGLPLEIRVSMTFKKLYNSMAITKDTTYSAFINNIALLDFLANLSGVNLNQPEILRKLTMVFSSKLNKVTDIPENVLNKIYDNIRTTLIGKIKY